MSAGSLKDVLDRLYSLDANDRVKAANEIGEIGTEQEAPIVLKVAYEDEASTVRQMAIQSYYEIMKEHGFEEIRKAALSHTDEYVRIYAINILGNLRTELVSNLLLQLIEKQDEKIQATAIKSMIHANTIENASKLKSVLVNEDYVLTRCNIIEAWGLWRYSAGITEIKSIFDEQLDNESSIELKTISALVLASFGDEKALTVLKESNIDEYYRIKVASKLYRGRSGLIEAVNQLKKL
ncbi:MAG: HEAT repeat domain-containing protein [Candidatus Kariarchaeaceae archaeon]|jgi:HEAT repeat protein